jgi:hypothetical protein
MPNSATNAIIFIISSLAQLYDHVIGGGTGIINNQFVPAESNSNAIVPFTVSKCAN